MLLKNNTHSYLQTTKGCNYVWKKYLLNYGQKKTSGIATIVVKSYKSNYVTCLCVSHSITVMPWMTPPPPRAYSIVTL